MTTRARRLILVLTIVAVTGGCAKGPPPDFFLLIPEAPSTVPGFEQGATIGIGPVTVPAHLDRNQIVSRGDGARLELSERNQWAEPVKAGVTRVLLVSMGITLDSNRIYALPLRQRRALDYQVSVDVLRLDGQVGGGVILAARWTVLNGDGKKALVTKVSRIEEAAGGPDMDALIEAQSRAVNRLGVEIAELMKEQFY